MAAAQRAKRSPLTAGGFAQSPVVFIIASGAVDSRLPEELQYGEYLNPLTPVSTTSITTICIPTVWYSQSAEQKKR